MIMSLSNKNLLEKHIKPLQVPQEGKLSEEQSLFTTPVFSVLSNKSRQSEIIMTLWLLPP